MASANTPTSKQAVLIGSVLAGLQIISGGTALADAIPAKAAALFTLLVAAIQVAWHNYNQAFQVTPNGAVAATVTDAGAVVAGPAIATGDGTPVDIAPTQ